METFRAMFDRPAGEVSPKLGEKAPSVRAYLLEGARQHWLSELQKQPLGSQEELLESALHMLERKAAGLPAWRATASQESPGNPSGQPVGKPAKSRGSRLRASAGGGMLHISFMRDRFPAPAPPADEAFLHLCRIAYAEVCKSTCKRNPVLVLALMDAPEVPDQLKIPLFLERVALPAWGCADQRIEFFPLGRQKEPLNRPVRSREELQAAVDATSPYWACFQPLHTPAPEMAR